MFINPTKTLLTPIHTIKRINPKFTYPQSGITFDIPRFPSIDMCEALQMNTIAKNKRYQELSHKIPTQATDKDLERLLSDNIDDSYNRAVWINPKDSKGYYLLKEDETKNGNLKLRILNEDGAFVKNATVQPQKVILTDLDIGKQLYIDVRGLCLSHADRIDVFARRFNPFAKYQFEYISSDSDIKYLKDEITPDTTCISASYGIFSKTKPKKISNDFRDNYINDFKFQSPEDVKILNILSDLTSKTRFLAGAGNSGEDVVSLYLMKTGCEGVGGLNKIGEPDICSSSRDLTLTQHYEPFSFNITATKEGINITGLKGTDIEYPTDLPEGQYLGKNSGTSYSTPIRAAKLALNKMMEGVV